MREAMRLRASAIFLVLVPSLVSAQGELAEPDASGVIPQPHLALVNTYVVDVGAVLMNAVVVVRDGRRSTSLESHCSRVATALRVEAAGLGGGAFSGGRPMADGGSKESSYNPARR